MPFATTWWSVNFAKNRVLRVLETSVLTSDQPWQTMGKTSLLEVQMDWSCFAEELYIGDWRVEGRDHENEGQVYVAIFSGPKARERAQEYADWKISKEQPRSRLHKVG